MEYMCLSFNRVVSGHEHQQAHGNRKLYPLVCCVKSIARHRERGCNYRHISNRSSGFSARCALWARAPLRCLDWLSYTKITDLLYLSADHKARLSACMEKVLVILNAWMTVFSWRKAEYRRDRQPTAILARFHMCIRQTNCRQMGGGSVMV